MPSFKVLLNSDHMTLIPFGNFAIVLTSWHRWTYSTLRQPLEKCYHYDMRFSTFSYETGHDKICPRIGALLKLNFVIHVSNSSMNLMTITRWSAHTYLNLFFSTALTLCLYPNTWITKCNRFVMKQQWTFWKNSLCTPELCFKMLINLNFSLNIKTKLPMGKKIERITRKWDEK